MFKFLRLVLAVVIANTICYDASSQSLGVNTTGAPAATSAILDVSSTDKGMLVPRMSKTERNAIASPATGLMVFQNAPDSVGFYYYDGTVWLWLATNKSSAGWLTTGNAGTTIANNFFGTTDNIPLSFRQNNKWLGRWNGTTSNYFIGDSSGYNNTGINNVAMGTRALFKNINAYGNVAIGNNAMENNTTGLRNVAVGDSSLFTQSYNPGLYLSDNTAIGSKALFFNQPTSNANGIKNTAIGNEAMYLNTTGSENTALGVSALRENTTGSLNTAIGRSANRLSRSGLFNTYIGYSTGYSDSTGISNTGVGSNALYKHQRGNDNVAVGVSAMGLDSSGIGNTAIGTFSGYSSDTSDLTVSVGYYAMYYNNRSYNTALGAYAGFSNSRASTNSSQGIENTIMGYAALNGNAFGSQNTAIGYKAMAIFEPGLVSGTSPSRNVGIGDSALQQNRGNDNVAIGYRSLSKANNTNQNQHVAVGSRALLNTTASYPNTAIGYSSQDSATTGLANTSLGSYSLVMNKLGSNNTAIGNTAMMEAYNPAGLNYPFDNTAVGNDALRFTRYYGHVAVGAGALRNDTAGTYNTAVGYLSMYQNLSGTGNAALGSFSMYKNKLSSYNTAVGNNALYSHTIAGFNYNTAVGASALEQDSSGFQNTGIGTSAFRNNITGFLNTGVGINAGYWQKKSLNTFIGSYSGMGERFPGNNYAADTGRFNTGLGAYSLYRMGNAEYNVGVGYQALYSDSSGAGNVAVGTYAMFENKISGYNTAVGYNSLNGHNSAGLNYNTAMGSFAMEQDSIGFQNTGVGTSAFRMNVTGFQNTGMGINAGYHQKQSLNTFIGAYSGVGERAPFNNFAVDTGSFNTGLGAYSLYRIANADYNVGIGYGALMNDSSGISNVAVGFNALSNITSGTQNTALGFSANTAANNLTNTSAIGAYAYPAQSNSMVLGSILGTNGAPSTVSVGIGTSTPGARLHVRRNGASGGTFIANASMIIEDNTQSYVQLSNPTNTENGILSGSAVSTIRSGIVFSADSSVYLRAGGNNNRMAIDNSGNIGIGTITPLTKLHIYESTGINVSMRVASVNSSFDPGMELVKTGSGADWKLRVDNGNLLTISRAADDFVAIPTDYYEMGVTAFRPAIDNNNALGGSLNRWTAVYAANGTIQTSDARDKENIADLNYGLNEIMKLRPVSFNWKENPQWGKKIGFIAQEVQPILNEVVQVGALKNNSTAKNDNGNEVTNNSDKLGIYYSDIIPVAVKAIQEQQAMIEKQAEENAALKEKNARLEKDILLIKEKLGIKN
ncbi:MAG: tail fiber domain-containing protein [Ferruginibacter sp.]